MQADPPGPLTAFPQTEAALRRRLARAAVRADTFRLPLARCSLSSCRGMCCHDGIYLTDEEACVLTEVAHTEGAFFRDQGLDLPEQAIVRGSWKGRVSGTKTAVRPWPFSQRVAGFPAHFTDTACVFLLEDGRCGLQVLSEARGRHPWHYKPTGCWLHPVCTDHGGENAVGLDDDATDPFRLPGYNGFVSQTFCGRAVPGGRPACEVLREELEFLGRIVGRDLPSEAAGSSGE